MESVSVLHVLHLEEYQHCQAAFRSCCGLILSLYNIVALLESCAENDTQAMLYFCVFVSKMFVTESCSAVCASDVGW